MGTIELIEAGITALETLAPALLQTIQSAGLDPDTTASYVQRIQTAMSNVPKPGT